MCQSVAGKVILSVVLPRIRLGGQVAYELNGLEIRAPNLVEGHGTLYLFYSADVSSAITHLRRASRAVLSCAPLT